MPYPFVYLSSLTKCSSELSFPIEGPEKIWTRKNTCFFLLEVLGWRISLQILLPSGLWTNHGMKFAAWANWKISVDLGMYKWVQELVFSCALCLVYPGYLCVFVNPMFSLSRISLYFHCPMSNLPIGITCVLMCPGVIMIISL